MFAIKFVNQNVGYVIGGDKIVKTTDGGNSWTIKYSAGGQLNDISTYGDSAAWVVGSDKIVKTIDIGESWNQQTFTPYHYLTNSSCVNSMVCFAFSPDGYLYKTTNGGLSAPDLNSPINKSTDQPLIVQLSWSSITQSNPFRVQISSNSNFNNLDLDSTMSGKSIQIGTLSLISKYYWRVQEKFGNLFSPWSEVWSFQTTNGSPNLSSPPNNSVDVPTTTTLSWNDVTLSANSYQLQLSTDSTFLILAYDDSVISKNNIEIKNLFDNTLYYWRVRAKIKNVYGAWSSKWQFITLAKNPHLISPLNNILGSDINVKLNWSIADSANEYRVQVSVDSLFRHNIVDSSITTNSLQTKLDYGTKYFWRVGAINFNGQTYWSNYWNFTTKAATKISFPLNIGNIWYYQAGSDYRGYYYGVKKEITDTLSNGFREVTDTYYYKDNQLCELDCKPLKRL